MSLAEERVSKQVSKNEKEHIEGEREREREMGCESAKEEPSR